MRDLFIFIFILTGIVPVVKAQEFGCTDPNAINFNPFATIDDGSCIYGTYGCTDPNALNYDPVATIDNGSCVYVLYGCTDPSAANYNPIANADDGSCYYYYYGCTDPNAVNYDPNANYDDGSCYYIIYGCTDPGADNYNPDAQVDDGSCYYSGTWGCTDPTAANYDPWANYDDGSCYYYFYGCTDAFALNYDPDANMDDGSCQYYYDCYGELNGSAYYDDCGQCVGGVTGIEPCILIGMDEGVESALSVYPNPTTGIVSLLLPESMSGITIIQLVELTGRVVFTDRVNAVAGVPYKLNLNVHDGTYVLHLLTSSATDARIPVVVSRSLQH